MIVYQENALLEDQLKALLQDCPWPVSAMSNMSALLWEALPDINWVGFYICRGDELVLGPFQGKMACTQIRSGKGVCGTCAATGTPQLVPDVHAFPGHIACDSASRSELVLPMVKTGKLLGVLDLDSPSLNRFGEADLEMLSRLVDILLKETDWDAGLL